MTRNTKKHIDALAKKARWEKKFQQSKDRKAERMDDYLEKRIKYLDAQRLEGYEFSKELADLMERVWKVWYR